MSAAATAKSPAKSPALAPAVRGSSLLFSATLMAAVLLMALVAVSPYMLTTGGENPDLLLLFARDMTVRRTGFFCAVGLTATAFIFFRPELLSKKKMETAPKPAE